MTLPPPLTPGDLLAAYAIVHVRARTAPDLQGHWASRARPGAPGRPVAADQAPGGVVTLTHGSLFAGYGGLDLAIEDVFGAHAVWVSEWEAAPSRVLAHHWPDAPNLGDVTAVDWSTVPHVDIISGGSPCQDLSHAGRRAGMTDGTRSNLWVAMREAIAVVKPTFVVWENVRGAMSADATSDLEHCPGCMGGSEHRGPVLRALGRVLGDLADLGFDAEWHGVRVSDIGGCHGRWRVFVLAYANGARLQGQPHPQGAAPAERHGHAVAGAGRPDLALLPAPTVSDTNGAGAHGTGGPDLRTAVALLPTPRATDGTKGGPNQRGSSGDLMLPSAVLQLDRSDECTDGFAVGSDADSSERTPGDQGSPAAATAGFGSTRTRWGEYAEAIASHEAAFGRPAPDPTEPGPKGNPRLSARFVEWMMGLPAGWVTDRDVTRNEALKMLGNGVVPAQAAHALRVMLARAEAAA